MDGLIASAFAAEGEVGDVDALFAEDGSDLSDHAGNVEVAADKQIAFERRFDVDAVELKQARLFAMNDSCRGMAGTCRTCADGLSARLPLRRDGSLLFLRVRGYRVPARLRRR